MTRFRAAGIHLAISAAVAAVVLASMLSLWYPGGYFKAMGGGRLLFILAGVDICIGPLLTLTVFRSGKKGLAFDLTAIAFMQAAALSYGASIMYQARPAFTVFAMDQFHIAAANDLDESELAKASRPEWRKAPLTGPVVVAANFPRDGMEQIGLIFGDLTRLNLFQLPRLYAPYAENRQRVLKAARPLSALSSVDPANAPRIEAFLRGNGRPQDDFSFVPLSGRSMEMAAIVDARTGELIDIIDARPR